MVANGLDGARGLRTEMSDSTYLVRKKRPTYYERYILSPGQDGGYSPTGGGISYRDIGAAYAMLCSFLPPLAIPI